MTRPARVRRPSRASPRRTTDCPRQRRRIRSRELGLDAFGRQARRSAPPSRRVERLEQHGCRVQLAAAQPGGGRGAPDARGRGAGSAHPGSEIGDVLDQVEEGRLAPVDVVEEDDDRLLGRRRFEQLRNGLGDLLGGRRLLLPAAPRSTRVRRLLLGAASCFTISTTGHYVIPSPYERHRPVHDARVACEARNSRDSRDLPTPGAPSTVKSRHVCSEPDALPRVREQPRARGRGRPAARRSGARTARPAASTETSRYAASGSALPFELDRRQQLGRRRRRATSWYGLRAEQDLAGRRRLLETRRDVDRVARHEPLLRAGDDLAGVDADPQQPSESRPALAAARAQRAARAPQARRPRATAGMPKTAITASPMNFSTVPPCRSIAARAASK